jgi:hypothetical protein
MARSSSLLKRRAKAATKRLSAVSNFVPNGLKEEALNNILPAFGSYAASRFLERMAFVQVMKRWPKLGKHAPVVAGLIAAVAAHYLGKKVKALKKYENPIMIGAAIALIQTLIQTYLPTFGWIVSDFSADQYKKTLGGTTSEVSARQISPSPAWSNALVPLSPQAQGFSEEEGLDITPSIAGVDVDIFDPGDLDLGSLGDSGDGLSAADGDAN